MRLSKGQRRLGFLGLVPVLAVVVGGGVVTLSAIRGKLDYDFAAEYRPPVEAVSIVADVPVEVVTSSDGKVHVEVSGTYTEDKPRTEVGTAADHALSIGVSCARSGCRIAVRVAMPSATTLSVTTAKTSLELRDLSGALTIHADNGSVDGVRLKSEQVTAEVVNGSLDLGFVRGASAVQASTVNGSLHLAVPGTAAYSIEAAATGGSTTLEVANDPGATSTLKLRADNGSITVDPSG